MTQEFKSIEEIKEEVAKEHISSGERATIEQLMTEVAKRHSQQYIESFDAIDVMKNDRIKDLEKSNKELVEMLEKLYYSDGWLLGEDHKKIQSLLTKHKQS